MNTKPISQLLTSLLIILFTLLSVAGNAQTYGLLFSGQDVNKDKRTGIDLTQESPFEFSNEFELSFDLSFNPDKADYFGYIVRVVMDDKQNYDFVYNIISNSLRKNFCVVAGSKLTNINFNLDKEQLFNNWKRVKILFDLKNDKVRFSMNNIVLEQSNAGLKAKSKIRVFFGANNFNLFKTTDVPSMMIKNIRIRQKQKDVYYWPLNEQNGNYATDDIEGRKAGITNPSWIATTHATWKNVAKFELDGYTKVTFNSSSETLYFINHNTIVSYVVGREGITRVELTKSLKNTLISDQIFYDPINQRLYRYFIEEKYSTYFNFGQKQWAQEKADFVQETDYWHHNKILSEKDTAVYIFGGYGHHKYKNQVLKLNYLKDKWETIKTAGDFFSPRYLAAAGKNAKGDTIFIVGGYGSESGEQILNPGNYYDLMAYSIANKSFKKIYEFRPNNEEFCFASSLVIDPATNRFYGLTFPQNDFNCKLQLIEGSLKNPGYVKVGDKIPYKFYDIKSFADLFYSPKSKTLLAVTIYCNDRNMSEINVYSIKFPPNISQDKGMIPVKGKSHRLLWTLVFGIGVLVVAFGIWYIRKRKPKTIIKADEPVKEVKVASTPIITEHSDVLASPENIEEVYKNAIFLFGDFQVFNKDGVDITKKFSPLLRELFLLILLYSLRHSKGISVEKLDEILWFDKDERSARNNRAVNIAKLKELLADLLDCQLSNNGGYWRFESEYKEVIVDYQKVLSLMKESKEIKREHILVLIKTIQRGSLLNNFTFEWLDDFKSHISNDIIDALLGYSSHADVISEPGLLVQIADTIFQFDTVNEDAMFLKCRALIALGKHSLAKQTYTRFVNEYKLLYNAEYKEPFNKISKL